MTNSEGVYSLIEDKLRDALKEDFLYKYMDDTVERFVDFVPNSSNLNSFKVLDSLIVNYYDSYKEWTIHYIDGENYEKYLDEEIQTNEMKNIISFVNSKIGVIEYINGISTLIETLITKLPEFIPGTTAKFVGNKEQFDKILVLHNLSKTLTKVSGYGAYLTDYDLIKIQDLDLDLVLSSRVSSVGISRYGTKETIMVPYDSTTTSESIIAEGKVLGLINQISLQNLYKETDSYIPFKDFREEFNNSFSSVVKSFYDYKIEIDYYNEINRLNPGFDAAEIHHLNTTIGMDLNCLIDALPNDTMFEDPNETTLIKGLCGYYYLKADKKSLGFLSHEEYDELVKS